jgi:hypothetical protein
MPPAFGTNMRRFNRLPCKCQSLFSSFYCATKSKAQFFSSTTSNHQKTKYLLPKRIILLRHGESLGNVDDTAYSTIPDWKIPLTRRCVLFDTLYLAIIALCPCPCRKYNFFNVHAIEMSYVCIIYFSIF